MSAASIKSVENLHSLLADKFAEIVEMIDVDTKGGAAMLNVMRQFVKDNNVEAVAVPGSPLGRLAEKVAEFPFDPAGDSPRH